MNDTELDDLVRAATPYPHGVPAVRTADTDLLEQILRHDPPRHRGAALTALTALTALAAAAAVAAAIVVPTLVSGHGRPAHPAPRPSAAASPSDSASVSASATPSPTPTLAPYTEKAIATAAVGPRLLIDAPGWSVTHLLVEPGGTAGEMTFDSGSRSLELDWYPASSYASYRDDRAHVSAVKQIPVLGVTGRMITYGRGDYAVMLPPARGIFTEIRSSGLPDLAAYRALLAQLREVGARAWLDGVGTDVVVPRVGGAESLSLLDGVPLPPGVSVKTSTSTGAQDAYQLRASLAGQVACGWLDLYTSGDARARQRAVAALGTAHSWPLVQQMVADGDYPQVLWQYTDDAVAGRAVTGYRGALGCR